MIWRCLSVLHHKNPENQKKTVLKTRKWRVKHTERKTTTKTAKKDRIKWELASRSQTRWLFIVFMNKIIFAYRAHKRSIRQFFSVALFSLFSLLFCSILSLRRVFSSFISCRVFLTLFFSTRIIVFLWFLSFFDLDVIYLYVGFAYWLFAFSDFSFVLSLSVCVNLWHNILVWVRN